MIGDTNQVSEKFSKRDFAVKTTDSQYPQHVLFQSVQDKTALLDIVSVGDTVEVSFNVKGREWTNPEGEVKYFNTLEAWRIEKTAGATGNTAADDDDPPF